MELDVQVDPRRAAEAGRHARRADRFEDAARAIMTTDSCLKTAYAESQGGQAADRRHDQRLRDDPSADGDHLGFVVTDAVIPAADVARASERAGERSVQPDLRRRRHSTNDTLVVLANGASGVKPVRKAFESRIDRVLEWLARQIAQDGEGARKLVTIEVEGASSEPPRKPIARSIANSPLVKDRDRRFRSQLGKDSFSGRQRRASGFRSAPRTNIEMQGILVRRQLSRAPFSGGRLKASSTLRNAPSALHPWEGRGRARFWTCDLTEEYIRINASYRT